MRKLMLAVAAFAVALGAKAALPSDYEPIDSIASTSGGKQWTRIGYTPACTDKIEFKVKIPTLGTMCVYCSRSDSKVDTFTCFLTDKNGYKFRFDRNKDVDNGYSSQTLFPNKSYEVVADGLTLACTLNGVQVATMGSGTFTTENERELVLFASYPKSTTELKTANLTNFAVFSLYYFRVTDKDGNVKVDLVPCIRKSDGSVGLYDIQRNSFYRSWSSNGFVCGDQGTVTVSDVVAKQRWPWNGLIDIDFSLKGIGWRDETYQIEVEARGTDGETVYAAQSFLAEPIVSSGAHRVTWDFGKDFPEVKAEGLTFAVMATQVDRMIKR